MWDFSYDWRKFSEAAHTGIGRWAAWLGAVGALGLVAVTGGFLVSRAPVPSLAGLLVGGAVTLAVRRLDVAVGRWRKFDEALSPEHKRRIMAFYKSMLQRHMYATGKKYFVAKNPAFSAKIEYVPICAPTSYTTSELLTAAAKAR